MVQTNSLNKQKIIIIGGPTASGKSAFAIDCALSFRGEAVGADSMQIYKGMDIGTGKVTSEETQGIPHHMIDILSPSEPYSVGEYLKNATAVIDDILARHKLPIIVGGTGLYINALINGMNFSDADKSEEVRERWKNTASEYGNTYIYEHLKKIDPQSADKININDTKRIIRAIEIYEVTGKTKSESATQAECKYDYLFFVINKPRDLLYSSINSRVDKMFEQGFYEEALSLQQYAQCQSMQAIGYKQIYEFLSGKYNSLDSTKEEIKKLTRNYAKRQLTFFKGIKANKIFLSSDDEFKNSKEIIKKFINNTEIL